MSTKTDLSLLSANPWVTFQELGGSLSQIYQGRVSVRPKD
jgi:hypothetical protein